ncbi:MAG TPA: type II toxin-antitoxin system MqsA family antitoxin [Pyrinomonadaceae bacterium]|nr:type II toxin-antitoxin system MqsA family antitoxin [Pyrinomonadaceae bacterium]
MKRSKARTIMCDTCGKTGARIIHVSRSYGKGSALLVIENVPVVSCPRCGESYLTAATLREIDNIKRNRSKIASTRPVPVAAFV